MVQTGDPTGTGKGGNSIWGKKFSDELRGGLKVTFFCFYDITRMVRGLIDWRMACCCVLCVNYIYICVCMCVSVGYLVISSVVFLDFIFGFF
jgi:hypothetical protein